VHKRPDALHARVLTRWLLPSAAALSLAADSVFYHWSSGLFALASMVGALLWSAWRFRSHRGNEHSRSKTLRRRFWWAASLAALGFVGARAHLVYAGLKAAEGPSPHPTLVKTYLLGFVLLMSLSVATTAAPRRVSRFLIAATVKPALVLTLSFAVLIGLGTLLLILPFSVQRLEDISFIDALFNITSAVCVTGLSVNEVGQTYTPFGQGVLLACIQLGGIGIMTIAGLVTVSLSGSSLQSQSEYAEMLEVESLHELKRMLRVVVFGTLVIESLGALCLWWAFSGDPRVGNASALWLAIFHAVSAFCNAGFSLFTANLTGFADAPGVQAVIMTLTVLGGLGFPVILELVRVGFRRLQLRIAGRAGVTRLSVHARTVCVTSGILIAAGALFIIVMEWSHGFESFGTLMTVWNGLFASVVSRSSGFATADLGKFREATLLLICALMFVGGSPASTAGGIKTTTAAVLAATLRGELLRAPVSLFRRAIPAEVVRRAGAVLTLSALVVLTATFLLSLTEDHPFLAISLEATSAFATTGLSVGITPQLSMLGKLVLTLTMFIGRVGPFTIALAAGTPEHRAHYRLAEERIIVG